MFHMPDAKQACLVAMKPKLLTPRPPKTPPPKSMPVEGHAPTAASESGSMPVKVEAYEVHDSPEEHDQTYDDEEDWGKWRQSWSVRGASQKGQEWETHYSNDTKEEWQEDDWDDSWNYGYGYDTKECKNDEHEYGTNDQESKEWVTDSSYGHEKEVCSDCCSYKIMKKCFWWCLPICSKHCAIHEVHDQPQVQGVGCQSQKSM
jgi:hypothetical protein